MANITIVDRVVFDDLGNSIGMIADSSETLALLSSTVIESEAVNKSVESVQILTDDTDEVKLKKLLKQFNLEQILPDLKAVDITYTSLQYISKDEIYGAIKSYGLRAEFREKLAIWKKQTFGIDNTTISVDSMVDDWLKKSSTVDINTPSTSRSSCKTPGPSTYSQLNVELILKETSKGRSLLNAFETNGILTNLNRDDLISILIEEIICSDQFLRPCDFPSIIDQICKIFPTENQAKDYYFIPRDGKSNPKGKLYSKYVNVRHKRRKLTSLTSTDVLEINNVPIMYHTNEIDETIGNALKLFLARDSSDWEAISDKWEKTYSLRQRDLKSLSSTEFLKAWPKFADSRAPKLINIDFNIMYPQKSLSLYSKWDKFKQRIKLYYEANIHNESCKSLLALAKSTINKDAEDYLLTILLNAVLLPSARFKDKTGRNKRKVTISDAQESFIMRLTCISDYENKITELVQKYFCIGTTIQPFIIIEGSTESDIKGFYIFFDQTLYQFESFLECLNVCFQLFQVLSLEYPQACRAPWVFIQKYFFNIHFETDFKSPAVISLLRYLE